MPTLHTPHPATQGAEQEKGAVYRGLLIQAIHQCAVRFPEVADSVVHVLMDFLSGDGAVDVVLFVRCVDAPPLPVGDCPARLVSDDPMSLGHMCAIVFSIGSYKNTHAYLSI
jgi:coatomer subunit beta